MNPDYDPQKAHEYYEKHKKLKGRTSTKGMTQSQREVASYVKNQLNAEKKIKITSVTETAKGKKVDVSAKAKVQRENFTKQCSDKVATLREKLKDMPKSEKATMKVLIAREIDSIKKSFADRKEKAAGDAQSKKSGITSQAKSDKAKIKTDYDNKYAAALDKIRGGE